MTDQPDEYVLLPHGSDRSRELLREAAARTGGIPRAVGICGIQAPQLLHPRPPEFCTLAAGHVGWHHNDVVGDWVDSRAVKLFDVTAAVEYYDHVDGVWEEGTVARDYGDDRVDVRAYGRTHRCRREDVRLPEALWTIHNPIWLIEEERRRVIAKGRTPEHDDEHTDGSLARAAAVYAAWAGDVRIPQVWPWPEQPKLWDTIDALVKAGQLITAEIHRLERAKRRAAEAKQAADHG